MGSLQKVAPVILALLLSGCFGREAKQEPVGETELAIAMKQVHGEWLADCPPIGEAPLLLSPFTLLQDYNTAAALGGACRARHNSLMEYLRPVLEKYTPQVP